MAIAVRRSSDSRQFAEAEPQGPRIGRRARVDAIDGRAGHVSYVVVERASGTITDIVVRHDGRDSLVPIDDVVSSSGGRVRLRITRAALKLAADYEPERFTRWSGVAQSEAETLQDGSNAEQASAVAWLPRREDEAARVREERLIIQRRRLSGASVAAAASFGQHEVFEVPLVRERRPVRLDE
jgi:hypothetical protein